MKMKKFSPRRSLLLICLICGAMLFSITLTAAKAQAQQGSTSAPKSQSGGDLGAVGAKLANPLSELWSLQFKLQAPQFYDGDVNTGDPEVGATMLFQPVLPLPLYGEGAAAWRLITRPIIPLIFSQPIPQGSTTSIIKAVSVTSSCLRFYPFPTNMQGNGSWARDRSGSFLPPRTMTWVRTSEHSVRPLSLVIRPSSRRPGSSRTTSGKSDRAARMTTRPT